MQNKLGVLFICTANKVSRQRKAMNHAGLRRVHVKMVTPLDTLHLLDTPLQA